MQRFVFSFMSSTFSKTMLLSFWSEDTFLNTVVLYPACTVCLCVLFIFVLSFPYTNNQFLNTSELFENSTQF